MLTEPRLGEPSLLVVDWDSFDRDNTALSEVPVLLADPAGRERVRPSGKGLTGTELVITGLRQRWTARNVADLHLELQFLLPPSSHTSAFTIRLVTDVAPELNGIVRGNADDIAEVALSARVTGTHLEYTIRDRIGKKQFKSNGRQSISWQEIGKGEPESGPRCGPLEIELLFSPRTAESARGTNWSLADLKGYLDTHAGIRIYRDNVRVRPYGDPTSPEGDWLGLSTRKTQNPAGRGRKGFRVGVNQVVGYVKVTRDGNQLLADSAGREGLIRSEAFADLRIAVNHCITLIEAHRVAEYAIVSPEREKVDAEAEFDGAAATIRELKSELRSVRRQVPKAALRKLERAIEQANRIDKSLALTGASYREILAEAGVLRGLASVGIASSVFAHETQSALGGLLASSTLAADVLNDDPPDVVIARRELGKVHKSIVKVGAWGAFSLARVRRDKRRRRKFDVASSISSVTKDLQPAFASAKISLTTDLTPFRLRAFEMDMEALVLNLLTNSYAAVLKRRTREVAVITTASVQDGQKGLLLDVHDSGTGVAKDLRDKIWQPLFTTRTDEKGLQIGTGLGLTIVKSVVDELGGTASVDRSALLGGAHFSVWIPGGKAND